MRKLDTVGGIPVLSWCKDPEDGAVEQITDASKHPCAFQHVALMPDAHQGYGVPIGAVVALKDAVSPNMVGVDIGCGMRAIKTSLTDISKEELMLLKERVKKCIPVGTSVRSGYVDNDFNIDKCFNFLEKISPVFSNNYKKRIAQSIGTLGGGNHFIEVQKGDDNHIWIMIHSGSRNLGKTIADHFNNVAKEYCSAFHSERNEIAPDLAFLPSCIEEFEQYMTAMNHALDFARINREVMINIVFKELYAIKDCCISFEKDIHHNYAAYENHFGKNIILHRKGATSARKGEVGIIPGSMGTCSYIVNGLGNPLSFNSCSHGAGRVHSRTAATMELDAEKEREIMKDVVCDDFKVLDRSVNKKIRGMLDLGEASGAYKNIDEVMENQSDLVSILTKLVPLMVVKG